MKKLFVILIVLITTNLLAQPPINKKERAIRALLNEQVTAWNRGEAEAFMQTYWKSDSLMFIGKNGVTRGWQQTLNNYKKNYPDRTAMGDLSFDIIKIEKISSKYFYVVGKWMLERTIGNLSGHYTLLFKKINRHWVIVSDHSS